MTAGWALPNWCETDGRYHPRNWADCGARAENRRRAEPAIDLDALAELVAELVAEKLAEKLARTRDEA